MNTRKLALAVLILTVGVIGGLAMSQERKDPTSLPRQVDATELERLSAQPSFEQTVFKLAADKLRQEKKPMTTVELSLTVRITKAAPNCWYDVCIVRAGNACLKYFYCRQD